jgi:ribonuclease J
MSQSNIKILPLGGLGEIGRNCTVIEHGDDLLVIDAGLMFPEEELLGVDLVIPDFRYLIENRAKVRAIVITHGHEDHIGGLPFLLRELTGVPVYATPLTRGLIEGKLKSHGLLNDADLHTILPGQQVDLGPFSVVPFHVNHSIPDSVGYAIRTPLGLIVHTGDFKIDHTPIEGRTTDLAALSRLANEGVMVLLADSTNAESEGYTLSERRLVDAFERAFAQASGRVIVATFASLLSRIQLVIETAARFGRKVAIAGRSMEENTAIAEGLGYIAFPPNTRVQLSEVNDLPDDRVCILATGSQGEPNAALARMAAGRFRFVQVREGDTIILSSKAIPGNETAIHRNIDNLFRRGANVLYGEASGMHVSGHAAQEELKLMLNLLRPLYFVPVHGAYRMLHKHASLAYAMGYPREDVFILENGQGVELSEMGARLSEPLELSPVYVDGSLVGDVGTAILRDRKALSQDGFVVARVSLQAGQVVDDPEIISQGFVYVPESSALLRSAESAILDTIQQHGMDCRNTEEIGQRIKRRLENLFYDETHRRPVVIPMVTAS